MAAALHLASREAPAAAAAAGAALGMSPAVAALFEEALRGPGGLILFAGAGRAATIRRAAGLAERPLVIPALAGRAEAERAAGAAQAGRTVLAGVDAADALGAIARLRATGLAPRLVAASLRAAFAGRRAARLCPSCRVPVQAAGGVAARLGFDVGAVVYEAAGCRHCAAAGEVAFYEAIGIDPAMRRLLACGGDPAIIASHAFRDRPDLGGAARALVRAGTIAPEEALRQSQ
jgi:general secretion pathway protein E